MKHLRNITCMAGLLTTPLLAQAQTPEKEDKKETKTPHFVIGVQGGTSVSLKNNTVRNLMDGTTGGPSSGLFLRYHIGNHMLLRLPEITAVAVMTKVYYHTTETNIPILTFIAFLNLMTHLYMRSITC